ncbi:hypothetical protein QTP88_002911 [Uroleucon formosanum]
MGQNSVLNWSNYLREEHTPKISRFYGVLQSGEIKSAVELVEIFLESYLAEFMWRICLEEQDYADAQQFKNFIRMSAVQFEMLLDLIKHQIVKQGTQLREAIPVHDRLMVTLRFLASGDAYSSLQYLFRIPPCTIIYDNLKEKYLKCPSSTEELNKYADQFELQWQFPHCFGVIDGKHITIVAPQNSGSLYYNYKNTHSIVLMGVANANYKLIYVDVGCNGRISDGGVFNNCSLHDALESKQLTLPEPQALHQRYLPVPYIMVADDAFTMTSYILKPYGNKKQNIKIMKYNLNKIPIEGNILIIDHGHISGNGKPYASKILESPTWLEICKIANDLIITTGTYFFKYLNDICVVHDLENIKICCLGMGVLSYVNKKIEIESPCYYNLDEKLKKYLGFQNRTFDFSLDINTSTMYVPNSNEQYINIEKQCEFRLGRNGQIPLGTIFIGIYSINEIENVFNSFGAIYVANFPKIKFEIINGFLNVTASIGLCFDEYLSNCLGFDYIGNFKKLIPINKTWPRGKEIVLGVEYTEPDIAYTVIGIKKPNLYTNVFLKNFNDVIRSNKVKTLIKGNYSIDQLNSKLPPGIKLQNDKNCITLTSKTDFYMDQNFKLSLGIENMYFLYKHNGDILNNKSLLDVHCNIIEKSFSSINDKCHIEEDLLYNFYYNDDNPYIKTNPIKYIPVNGGFQEIKIDIINQDGKKYDFDDDNFIVYLDLIKE